MKRLLIVIAALAIAACNKGGREAAQSAEFAAAPPSVKKVVDQMAPTLASGSIGAPQGTADAHSANAPVFTETPASMLIRTGSAAIEVDKLDPAIT
jgi:hypothetical protein